MSFPHLVPAQAPVCVLTGSASPSLGLAPPLHVCVCSSAIDSFLHLLTDVLIYLFTIYLNNLKNRCFALTAGRHWQGEGIQGDQEAWCPEQARNCPQTSTVCPPLRKEKRLHHSIQCEPIPLTRTLRARRGKLTHNGLLSKVQIIPLCFANFF